MVKKGVTMEGKAFINKDNFIEIVVPGDQTPAFAEKTTQEIMSYADELRAHKKRVIILNDVSRVHKVPVAVRKKVAEGFKQLQFDKMAIFGVTGYMMYLVNFLIVARGQGKIIKYFHTRGEAERWLQE